VARDDSAKRIVVSLRGSSDINTVVVDLLTYQSPTGVISGCSECRVHAGFLLAAQSVETTVVGSVEKEIEAYPEYQLLVTGHSMGGAVAVLLVSRFSSV
jgi:putative lipase involved disintegration of autophagic bodies